MMIAHGEEILWRYTDREGAVHFVADRMSVPTPLREGATPVPLTTVTDSVDAPKPTARLAQPGAAPLTMIGRKPATVVRFGPKAERTMLLDTGAGFTTVTTKLARALGADLTKARPGRFATPSGTVTAPVIVIRELTIGPATVRNVTAAAIDHPGRQEYAGLIGMNVLSLFVFTVDPAGGTVRFEGLSGGK